MGCKNFTKAVCYYRVSTQRQGVSGLGLESQLNTVTAYAASNCLEVVGSYTEVESGKKSNRAQLTAALAHAKKCGAILLIAKLDRLARNVAFVSTLMDSGVDFAACDMPDANRLTVHIIAAMAEHEARAISERVTAALKVAKERGVVMGTPANLTKEAQLKSAAVNHANFEAAYKQVKPYITMLQKDGLTLRAIAERLNAEGHTTRTGSAFTAMQVTRILKSE